MCDLSNVCPELQKSSEHGYSLSALVGISFSLHNIEKDSLSLIATFTPQIIYNAEWSYKSRNLSVAFTSSERIPSSFME